MTNTKYILGITAADAEETYHTREFTSKKDLANFLAILCARVSGRNANFSAWDGYRPENIILTTPENLINFCLEKYLHTLELNDAAGAYFDDDTPGPAGRWRGEPEQTLRPDEIVPALRTWQRELQARATARG